MMRQDMQAVFRVRVDGRNWGNIFDNYPAVRCVSRAGKHTVPGLEARPHGTLFLRCMAPGEASPRFHEGDELVQWTDGKWTIERGGAL